LYTSSVAVLDENLVDAVLDLMTAFTQSQVHVCDGAVLLHGFLQLSTAFLHADHPRPCFNVQPLHWLQ